MVLAHVLKTIWPLLWNELCPSGHMLKGGFHTGDHHIGGLTPTVTVFRDGACEEVLRVN